jgi:gliding motility-associated-like protein
VGSSFSSGSTTCSWQQFTEEWNSGTSTSITFSIRSQGGFAGGNDYALDDIAFSAMTQFTDTILVNYQDLVNLDLGPDTSLCEVQMLGLNAYVENAEYLWQDSSDLSFFNVFQEGLYWVDVSHGVCVQTDSIYVNYDYIYDNFLGNDSNFCVSDSIVLSMDIDYATYLWSDSTTSNQFIITEEGAYWLEVSVGNCVESDTINIDDSAILAIDFGPDTSVCIGETILLDAGNPGASFLWQDQSTNETYLVEEEGLYSVEVGSGSCSFYGEIFVAYYDPPDIDLGDDESICIGSSLELGVALDDLSYLWQDNSQDSIFIVDEAGLYWLQVVHDICAYVSSDSIVIDLEPYPYLYLGPDTTICVGTELTIGSDFFGASFEWQDGSIGPLFTVEEDGLYWLIIENQCGTARDSIFIEYIDCECPFYMPNSFTPNGDLDNDYFPPNYQCNFLEFYFVIYDRWGSIVFETNDPYAQWDGNIDGQLAPLGVYPYAYQFLHFIEYRKGSGFVNLLR